MKNKKWIISHRALSWLLAVTLTGTSMVLPVQASDFSDDAAVEASVETDAENTENAEEGTEVDLSGEESAEESVEEENPEEISGEDFSSEDTEETFSSEEETPAAGLAGAGTTEDPYLIEKAEDLPAEIPAGTVYALKNDITLTSGQQITVIAGTLDGKGHVVTLADKPLAATVSGIMQNLGVTGSISVDDCAGTMAVKVDGGIIQNCYSKADITTDSFSELAGITGTMVNGTIRNCYYTGKITPAYDFLDSAGVTVYMSSGENSVSNCYYTITGDTAIYKSGKYSVTDCAKKTTEDFQSGAVTALLNENITATGYSWSTSSDGYPELSEGKAPSENVDWTAIDDALAKAELLKEEDYTKDTWKTLQEAVAAAKALKEAGTAGQADINKSASAVTEAIAALKKPNPSSAVKLPEDTSKITYISTQADFAKLSGATKDSYFVLSNDITIDSKYIDESFYMPYETFGGILDGQGHTIIFDKATSMINGLTATGVVQNVGFKGTMEENWQPLGPLGVTIKGSIINCWSDISGKTACGFAKTLSDDAVVSNCFAYGESAKGGIINTYNGGTLKNTHWLDTLTAPSYPADALESSGAVSENAMKTMDFVDTLNANRGDNGTSWGQSSTGYAYFGENQSYTPGGNNWPELPGENTCAIAFKSYDEKEAVTLDDAKLQVSPDFVNGHKIAGTFSLPDYEVPEGCSLKWSLSGTKPEGAAAISEDSGEFFVYQNGKAVVNAYLVKADGSEERLASAAVISKASEIKDIKLFINDQDVTNGTYTVEGSAVNSIKVKALYDGENEYRDTAYSSFTYDAADSDYIHNENVYSSFYFKKPGTSSITVTVKKYPDVKASVELTSTYVAVESIRPALSGEQTVHGRNANSDGQETDGRVAFNPIQGGAIVEPANASYGNNWTIKSSDETIGYYDNGSKVYVPKQMGTVTYTAEIEDKDPETGMPETKTGTSEVTYKYLNPVTSVKAPKTEFTVEEKGTEDFSLDVLGARSAEGYSVSDPSIVWTYDKKGVAAITRTKSGAWKREEGAPDTNQYFLASDYKVTGISEGTVTATGTPVDQTNHPKPIVLTIKVTRGDIPDTDNQALAREGAQIAVDWIKANYADGFKYGNEWPVFTLIRHGETIPQEQLDAYYESVVKEIKTWTPDKKPTDIAKVAMALTIIGKDITDIEGINLAEWMYDSTHLTDGSNEFLWVLLALDAADIKIPDNAKWTREAMIEGLLKFQNPEKGFFGLTDNKTGSIDLTAMSLQPLSRYQAKDPKVEAAVKKAVSWLKNAVGDDYGFGTSEGTSQVILALTALGIDPTLPEKGFGSSNMNMITNLMDYKGSKGGFIHTPGMDIVYEISTIQALEAFDSYLMLTKDNTAYWDLKGSAHVTHKWSQWKTTSAATVFKKAVQTHICSVCGAKETRETGNKLKATMKVSETTLPMKVGQTVNNFKVTGMAKGDSVKSWKSSNTKIIKVSGKSNGRCKLTAQKRTGTAKITITLKSGLKKTVNIKVQKTAVKTTKITGFRGGKNSVTLKKGEKFSLIPVRRPVSSREKAIFTSSNKKVVTVDAKGHIKALKAGKATITVKINKKKATFKITVK